MKNTLLITGFVLFGAVSNSLLAQSDDYNSEQIYSHKPIDENPYSFQSNEELERTVPGKIEELKKLIIENKDFPDRVKAFKETIWRYEHAIVAAASGAHSTKK